MFIDLLVVYSDDVAMQRYHNRAKSLKYPSNQLFRENRVSTNVSVESLFPNC